MKWGQGSVTLQSSVLSSVKNSNTTSVCLVNMCLQKMFSNYMYHVMKYVDCPMHGLENTSVLTHENTDHLNDDLHCPM